MLAKKKQARRPEKTAQGRRTGPLLRDGGRVARAAEFGGCADSAQMVPLYTVEDVLRVLLNGRRHLATLCLRPQAGVSQDGAARELC